MADIPPESEIVVAEIVEVMQELLHDIDEGNIKSENIIAKDCPTSKEITATMKPSKDSESDTDDSNMNNSNKKEPILIDLGDEDDDTDYSKENIEKAPEKSLPGLIKNLSGEQTAEIFSKIKVAVSKLPRETLEDMYCNKILEFIESSKRLRTLEIKEKQLNVYKDRVNKKVICLQKQVIDLSKAMKNVTENIARNPKYIQQSFTPIKFYRAVGVQVRTEQLPRLKPAPLADSQLINHTNTPATVNLPVAGKSGQSVVNSTVDGVIESQITQGQQGLKRINKPTISVSELRNQVQPEPIKISRKAGPASATARQVGNIGSPNMASPVTSSVSLTNGSPTKASSVPNGLIDLTVESTGNTNVIIHNGVQYTLINPTTMPCQLLPQAVTTGLQSTPILAPIQSRAAVPIRAPVFGQRPSLIRQPLPAGRIAGSPRPPITPPRPALTITQRLPTPVPRPVENPPNLPKFVLPDLPASSPQPKKVKEAPPRPTLNLQEQGGGIVLSWTHLTNAAFAEIQSYQIFACQESLVQVPGKVPPTPQWKRVGDVKALPLPMACTLSQFAEENRYYFVVRGVDVFNRTGQFCDVATILLKKKVN